MATLCLGDSEDGVVIHCDARCAHTTCGVVGSRCRLAYCEPCLEAAFAGDHRDRHGNLRESWRCPLCRIAPKKVIVVGAGGGGGAGVDWEWWRHAVEEDPNYVLGETLPLLRDGWRSKLQERTYRRYGKKELAEAEAAAAGPSVDDSSEEGDGEADGRTAPGRADNRGRGATGREDDVPLPAPGDLKKLGDYYCYNPVEVRTDAGRIPG